MTKKTNKMLYSAPTLLCIFCNEEWDSDYHGCSEDVFSGAVDQLPTGIEFYQRRIDEGFRLWENDTLLVLAQQELSLRAFNERVRKILRKSDPDTIYRGLTFSFGWEPDAVWDGRGKISASPKTAPAVAEALY